MMKKILVTGGAGYVGAELVPMLLDKDYQVTVLDLFLYGRHVFDHLKNNSNLILIEGDIRDLKAVKKSLIGQDIVIHLAAISNDPSFDLDPKLGHSINYTSFRPLVEEARNALVKRFINISSSSVYGLKEEQEVHEGLKLTPLTDYSKYKAQCEIILQDYQSSEFTTVNIRPATVCGYSKRQRLDLVTNIMVNHAHHREKITVFGGEQLRPNIHIDDICDLYTLLCHLPDKKIAGKTFNAGNTNFSVKDIALAVQKNYEQDKKVEIIYQASDDLRSYHISSKYIERELGFRPKRTITHAINDLKNAFNKGLISSPNNNIYYNVKHMREVKLL